MGLHEEGQGAALDPLGPAAPDPGLEGRTPGFWRGSERAGAGRSDVGRFDGAFRERFVELLRWRRDVRHFRREPLPAGLVEALIEVAQCAPSVGLSEPWRFVLVEDAGRREAVRANFADCNARALAGQAQARAALYAGLKLAGLAEAPCHLALFAVADPAQGHGLGRATMKETVAYSAVMAAHTLWLLARAAGVGMGWVSILDAEVVGRILEVDADWVFIGYFCLGYPQAEDDVPELERHGWECRRAGARLIRR